MQKEKSKDALSELEDEIKETLSYNRHPGTESRQWVYDPEVVASRYDKISDQLTGERKNLALMRAAKNYLRMGGFPCPRWAIEAGCERAREIYESLNYQKGIEEVDKHLID